MLITVLSLTLLAFAFGLLIELIASRFQRRDNPVVEQINDILPQTQCGQCGYPGCRPYAEAIARGEADINRCPPGGEAAIVKLADLLGRDVKPLDEARGEHKPPRVAFIDEDTCIGCTLCIQACPVDAILGAPKVMTTIISDACTGCELCIPPCPVDCITMIDKPTSTADWQWRKP